MLLVEDCSPHTCKLHWPAIRSNRGTFRKLWIRLNLEQMVKIGFDLATYVSRDVGKAGRFISVIIGLIFFETKQSSLSSDRSRATALNHSDTAVFWPISLVLTQNSLKLSTWPA